MIRARWWSAYARVYDWLWDGPLTDELATAVVARLVSATGPVLEFGTGTGLVGRRLAGVGPVVGIDSNGAMVRGAEGRVAYRVLADARWPPVRPRSVGVLVAANLLHLCPSPETTVDALARLLRPGGRMVLTWPGDAAGPRRLYTEERRYGCPAVASGTRMAARAAIALTASVTCALRRVPAHRLLDTTRVAAARYGMYWSHDVVLAGIQHIVVMTTTGSPGRRCDEVTTDTAFRRPLLRPLVVSDVSAGPGDP